MVSVIVGTYLHSGIDCKDDEIIRDLSQLISNQSVAIILKISVAGGSIREGDDKDVCVAFVKSFTCRRHILSPTGNEATTTKVTFLTPMVHCYSKNKLSWVCDRASFLLQYHGPWASKLKRCVQESCWWSINHSWYSLHNTRSSGSSGGYGFLLHIMKIYASCAGRLDSPLKSLH